MIGTTFYEYIFIRTSIFLLRSVTPICICYTTAYIIRPLHFLGAKFLFAYAAIETGFYLFIYLPRTFYLQTAAKHPECISREHRRVLFERCIKNIPDPERYLSKWFHDASQSEIKKENVKDFFRWALMNTGEFHIADEEELDEYVHEVEKLLNREIPPGRGKAIPLRLTIDKFYPQHRPLIWYMVRLDLSFQKSRILTLFQIVSVADAITFSLLCYHSFEFYRSSYSSFFSLFPFRPIAVFTRHRSPAKTITYWHRPHTSKEKPPILFIHGNLELINFS